MDMAMEAKLARFGFFLTLALMAGLLVGWKILRDTDVAQVGKVVKVGQAEIEVEIAATDEERSRGLGGRDSLAEDEGMMFVFDQPGQYGFWMKGMRFALDFIWIRQGKVVEVSESVSAEDQTRVYQPKGLIDAMVEVNAGWVKRQGVKVGDEVVK